MQVKGVICDNHPTNVSAYKKLIDEWGTTENSLFISLDGLNKTYLFYDTVHLVKNIRNNLVGRKRFIFPPFSYSGFDEKIIVNRGEITWKLFHDVRERDYSCTANLRKAPKLSSQVREFFYTYYNV